MNSKQGSVGKPDSADPILDQYNAWMLCFAERFREARLKAGLTQEGVASRLPGFTGEGQSYISKIERAQVNLTARTMLHLAAIVGVNPNKLVRPIPVRRSGAAHEKT